MAKKKTHQQFIEEVYNLEGDSYEVIGEYINTGEKLVMRHVPCNHEYLVSPNKFLNGRRCPKCSQNKGRQKRSKTHRQFIKEVKDLVGDVYEVLSEYKKSKEKVEFRHNTCGTVFMMQPSNFLTGQRCVLCSRQEGAQRQRHTSEFFINEVFKLVGDKYTVLGEYLNNTTPILIKHNDCGFEYPVRPSNFKSGKRCPKCRRGVQRTPDMYREEVFDLVGNEYIIIGDFNTTSEGVLTRHNECGFEWSPTPSNFLKGKKRCPKCYGNILKTQEQFAEEVYELSGGEYTVLGQYQSSKTPILMKHLVCGNEFMSYPSKFVGQEQARCPKCSLERRAKARLKTTHEFKMQLYEVYGNEYEVLGEYTGIRKKILIRHKVCGKEYYKSPIEILNRNCKVCSDIGQRKTHNEFLAEVFDLVGNEYVVLEEYSGIFDKINIKHNICGNVWKASPHKFLNGGRRCPRCNSSKGELAIAKYLETNNFKYQHQARYEDCKNERPLPFDFKVFDSNNHGEFLIEFDGIQHFKPLEVFGGQEGFDYRIACDEIKNNFCTSRNIPILRIKYTALNEIDEILNQFMNTPSSLSKFSSVEYMTNDKCNYLFLV